MSLTSTQDLDPVHVKSDVRVGIIIPVFNQLHYTRDCLAGLAGTIASGADVVVINNGSNDALLAEFLAAQTGITVINNPENRGCAAGWNQGVQVVSGEWIVVLNNDVSLPDGWLQALIAFAEVHNLGIASPSIREGELNYDLPAYACKFTQKMRHTARWGAANGICFIVHRRVFEQIGLFDEKFRIGQFEDVDFFLRARRAGIKLGITGSSFIHHFGSITQNALRRRAETSNYEAENRAYFRAKWRIGWLRRRWQRFQSKTALTRWRLMEYLRHGHSLNEKWLGGRMRFY